MWLFYSLGWQNFIIISWGITNPPATKEVANPPVTKRKKPRLFLQRGD